MKDLDKYRGCLIGGAAGDALGYPIEFFDEGFIFQKYGPTGITEYELCDGVAQISDDTQMTLFTAVALLVNKTRLCTRGMAGPWQSMAAACYHEWYRTQTEEYPIDLEDPYSWSWLLNIPELFSRRAPGTTCLATASELNIATKDKASNNSKGCGGVMRIAPVGLYFGDSNRGEEEIDKLGADIAALTHGHELGYIPAAALTHIIMRIAHKEDSIRDAVQSAIDIIEKMYPRSKNEPVLCRLLRKAIDLSKQDIDDLDAIHTLGQGWVAEETLAIAAYCALKYPDDFEKAIVAAVNHEGDSDSTGAVVGNIVGANVGLTGIPDKFREKLELYDVIMELAEDLYNDCQISEYSEYQDDTWECKYLYRCYPRINKSQDYWKERMEEEKKEQREDEDN